MLTLISGPTPGQPLVTQEMTMHLSRKKVPSQSTCDSSGLRTWDLAMTGSFLEAFEAAVFFGEIPRAKVVLPLDSRPGNAAGSISSQRCPHLEEAREEGPEPSPCPLDIPVLWPATLWRLGQRVTSKSSSKVCTSSNYQQPFREKDWYQVPVSMK